MRVWNGPHNGAPIWYITNNGEPPLEQGKQRVCWRCVRISSVFYPIVHGLTEPQRCGHYLYDNFKELRPGALNDLEQMLSDKDGFRQNDQNDSRKDGGGFRNSLIGAAAGILDRILGRRHTQKGSSPTLPMHHVQEPAQDPSVQTRRLPETVWLLVCIPHRKYATKVVHLNVCDLQSDRVFFKALKSHYRSMRGQWMSFFSLQTLYQVQFVRFEMHPTELVDTTIKDDISPEAKKYEYRYRPLPADYIPPIGRNYMKHLYDYPEEAGNAAFCIDGTPKKLRERL